MYSKLTTRASTFLLLTLVALTMASGAAARAADSKNSGSPAASPPAPPTIDPRTRLPRPPWKDPDWPDPDKMLPDVVYDAIPLAEVARHLRKEFKDAFDILIPNTWQDRNISAGELDPGSTAVKLQLKNVFASEVFNAMNLMFEVENTPYRWELKLNGNRPIAMLRVLPELLPPSVLPPPPRPQTRQVYFVGDLTSDEKSGGMTMEQLVKTVSEVYQMSYGESKGVLQFHKDAQLLIVTGSADQIQFVQQTLSALREKLQAQPKPPAKPAAPGAKAEETKPR